MEGQRRIFVGIAIFLLAAAGGLLYLTRSRQNQPAQINLDFPDTIEVGSQYSVPLKISVPVAANAAEFYFKFPADLIEVESIDTTNSIFQLWITGEPKYSNETGEISFAGGLPTPGFIGKDGLIATVKFSAKKSGVGQIVLNQERSRILANDSLGTEIESTFKTIDLQIYD